MTDNKLLETINETNEFLKKITWNYLDNNLLKEDIEVLKLRYDVKHRFLTAAHTWFFASIPLAYTFYDKSSFLFWYFVLVVIISLIQIYFLNVETNKLLVTIEYKLKNETKLKKILYALF